MSDIEEESAEFVTIHIIAPEGESGAVEGFTEEEFLERSEITNLTKHEIYAIIDYYFRERYHQEIDHLQMGDSTRDHWGIGERIAYFRQFVNEDRVVRINEFYNAELEKFETEFLTDSDAENTV